MNKFRFLLILLCLLAFSSIAFADNANDKWTPNWGVPDYNPYNQPAGEDSEQVWDSERENVIKSNFGTDNSPEYMNTSETPDSDYNVNDKSNGGFEDSPYEGGE